MHSGQTQEYSPDSPAVSLTVGELKDVIAQAARDDMEIDVALANKWEGGEMVLRPGNAALQEKVIPLDAFFHKIVMLRDRIRVLEQKINTHPKLSDVERVELQQYITRVYGSLTTFNVLFQHREDQFRGESRGAEPLL